MSNSVLNYLNAAVVPEDDREAESVTLISLTLAISQPTLAVKAWHFVILGYVRLFFKDLTIQLMV